jgi:hypothetical protein
MVHVLIEQPQQVTLVQDVVEALAPERLDQALGDSIRLRTAERAENGLDADRSRP